MEKSADICVRLSFSSRRGGFSRLGSLRRLLAITVRSALYRLVSKSCRFSSEKTPFSPLRPGPVCYNVTMEVEILPCSSIYTYCDITGMSCAGVCWEMKYLFSFFSPVSLFILCRSRCAKHETVVR